MTLRLKNQLLILLFIIPIIAVGIIFVAPVTRRAFAEQSVYIYTESLDEIVNPAAGFYKRVTVRLQRNNSNVPFNGSTAVTYYIGQYSKDYGIIQLCFDIADFSANAGGVDVDIDDDALSAIEKVFQSLRDNKVGAIIRFDYDRDGLRTDREPALDMILKHIKSVSKPISKYSDVILGVESGMLGPWGEQHTTTLGRPNGNEHTYYSVVETWLNNTPQKIGVTVRRPLYFAYWANEKFDLHLTVSDLADLDVSAYPSAERIGVYNDGYLGSSSDLGTFTDREKETAFIGSQAEKTYYGGELVADSGNGLIGAYNSVSFLEQEGFVTHTSYLNIDWNDKVFAEYKKNTYSGKDTLYDGNTTEFTYVKNRLGYRFYLSKSEDITVNGNGTARLKFTVANAGFARIICPIRCELVFKNDTISQSVNCTEYVDLSKIPAVGERSFELSVAVPQSLPVGNCNVYLRVYTEYGAEIRFANDVSVCDIDRKGVKVGTVTKALAGIAVTSVPTKTAYFVGDILDLTGLVVTASYSDGSTETIPVTTDMLSDYDMSIAGEYDVKIMYEGAMTTFEITVEEIVLTRITVSYSGKLFYTSGTFDRSELTVKAVYSDLSENTVTDYTLSDFDMSAGTKNVTVTYSEEGITKTKTFSFTVYEVALAGIEVTVTPTKTSYFIGDSIDLTGLSVTATYNDDATETVTATIDMLSEFDMSVVGEYDVKITYEGKTATFKITVEIPVLTSISAIYSGKQYYTSETFARSELTVKAFYSDLSEKTVTDYILSDFDMTEGIRTVIVTYSEDGITKTDTFLLTINEVSVTGIEVTAAPIKAEYTVGDELDLTGLAVNASYNDGTTKALSVTLDMLSFYDMETAGKYSVKITYGGQTATFDITVKEFQNHKQSEQSFGSRFKNFINNNAVAVGCVAASVLIAAFAIIMVVVKRRK